MPAKALSEASHLTKTTPSDPYTITRPTKDGGSGRAGELDQPTREMVS